MAKSHNPSESDEPEFEPFLQKGGRLVTTKTASVSMSDRGILNIPGSVRSQIFHEANYIQFHADIERELLALEPFGDEDDAPSNSYKISGDGSGSIQAEKVLCWMGKDTPDEHTLFELKAVDEMPYIDVGDLPELE
jgi:hypothetical protein